MKAVELKILRLSHHLHRHQMVRVVCVVMKIVVTLCLLKTDKEKDMGKDQKAIEVLGYVCYNAFFIFKTVCL